MTNATHDQTMSLRKPAADNIIARFSQALVSFAERWFPDAYVFVLIAVIAVAGGAMLHGGSPLAVSRAFGDGFWNLIPFTMQMALVAIGGYVVALSPPVAALLARLASVPKTGRGDPAVDAERVARAG